MASSVNQQHFRILLQAINDAAKNLDLISSSWDANMNQKEMDMTWKAVKNDFQTVQQAMNQMRTFMPRQH